MQNQHYQLHVDVLVGIVYLLASYSCHSTFLAGFSQSDGVRLALKAKTYDTSSHNWGVCGPSNGQCRQENLKKDEKRHSIPC